MAFYRTLAVRIPGRVRQPGQRACGFVSGGLAVDLRFYCPPLGRLEALYQRVLRRRRPVRVKTLDYGQAVGTAERASDRRDTRRDALLGRLARAASERGLRIAYDLLGSRDQAEDAVQEALARACESCDRVREPDAVEGWFYRVLTNICLRTLRRRRFRQLFFGRAEDAGDSAASPRDARVDNVLARQGDIATLMHALDRLPAMQRTALLLRYGHDQSITDIAGMLGVQPATVKTHLVRGLRKLRTIMERERQS